MYKNKATWTPASWQNESIIKQIPKYENIEELLCIKNNLKNCDSLISHKEILQLKSNLSKIEKGEGFFIQGGYCAESFRDFNSDSIEKVFFTLENMANVLSKSLEKEVTIIGRLAGQFAKPRSNEFEIINDEKLLPYKGDIINSIEPTKAARKPDPKKMEQAYNQSLNTIKILNDLSRNSNYQVYTSHEALLLHYEESLIRKDKLTENVFLSSAHLPWIGIRTCELNSAHVEFLKGVINPIAIKCGITTNVEELKNILSILNPSNEQGKIVLISRMGVENSRKFLMPIIEMIKNNKLNVIWCCDPMHGNTKKLENGIKTRYLSNIIEELKEFFEVCKLCEVYPGGIHLEMSGDNVTECIGGSVNINNINTNYKTLCDPCLNSEQSTNLINEICKMI